MLQVGVDAGIETRLGIAQQRNDTRDKLQARRRKPQVEFRAGRRKVPAQPQGKRIDHEAQSRGVVLVADRSLLDTQVPHRKAEGGGRLLRPGARRPGGVLRIGGFHDIPVHRAVGTLVRMKRGGRKDHLRNLETAVAEERQGIDDDRKALHRGNRIALETIHADKRHAAHFERRLRKMAQEADVQRSEIEFCSKDLIGLPFHDLGDLVPQQQRRRKQHQQQNGDRRKGDLQQFLHDLSTLRANTTVSTSSKPVFR